MKKEELVRRLARESGVSAAAAADRLDELIYDILRKVRQGRTASLPGLGRIRPKLTRTLPLKASASRHR
jgi:nucleoid DNA-binding protein